MRHLDHTFAGMGRLHWVRPAAGTPASALPAGIGRFVLVKHQPPDIYTRIGFFAATGLGDWCRDLSEQRCRRWWKNITEHHDGLADLVVMLEAQLRQ